MKKLIMLTTALVLTACLAPSLTAAADDGGELYYPAEFERTLEFSSLADYAFEGEKSAFADATPSGSRLYVIAPDEFGDNRLTTVDCSFAIDEMEYHEGTLYLQSSQSEIYSYSEGEISPAVHAPLASRPNTVTDSRTGYMYLIAEAENSFGLVAYSSQSALSNIFADGCSKLKKIGDEIYIINEGTLYNVYENSAKPMSFGYVDLTLADALSAGNAAELLKEDYEVQTAVVHPQTAEGKHAYVTKIDISSLGETFTAQGTERLIADRQALVLASSGNAAIVLMADDEGEPACYITLADALEMTAYTPADNDMDKAYARSEVTIFTRPYMCDATVADTVESGTVFTVLEKCSLELTDGAFYRVEYTAEGQTRQGFAVGRSLSPYTFAAENDTEQTTGDKNFTYDNPWQTVVAVLLIVLLVLVGVGYVTFYATKKSAKANKKQAPPSDDDLYMRD